MEKVRLEWSAPKNLLDFSKKTTLTSLYKNQYKDNNCVPPHAAGVYCHIYPKDIFGKTGYYFGSSKNLYNRTLSHYKNTLQGDYIIPKYNPDNFDDFEFYPMRSIGALADKAHLKRNIEHVFEFQIIYAVCEERVMNTVERALYKMFKERYQNNEDYFLVNKRTPNKKSINDVIILNTGDDLISSKLGSKIRYEG